VPVGVVPVGVEAVGAAAGDDPDRIPLGRGVEAAQHVGHMVMAVAAVQMEIDAVGLEPGTDDEVGAVVGHGGGQEVGELAQQPPRSIGSHGLIPSEGSEMMRPRDAARRSELVRTSMADG
jgi:hypothetical protein